jgi:hypothetical protein
MLLDKLSLKRLKLRQRRSKMFCEKRGNRRNAKLTTALETCDVKVK